MQLRKRLICHYCSQKSSKSKLDGDRFQCEKCGSVNIYDENGEIVDVSPEEAGGTQRYASQLVPFEANDIFCSTCVKNQHLYTSALSEFLPDPEDPKYDEIEAALPKFKKHLEQRYPQCCARCEPRVKAQLEQATYNARSDHMRRMLERSRARRIANSLGWRSLLVNGAGIGYFASVAVQLGWHAMRLTVKEDDSPVNSLVDCIPRRHLPAGCAEFVKDYIGWSMLAALVCVWWNPRWQHKIGGYEGRLVGLGKYYQLQLALLVIRFVAWMWLVDFPPAQMYQEMLHSLFFVAIMVTTIWAMVTVKVDKTPLVNWEYQQPELVSEKQFVPPSPMLRPAFNISALAPPTRPDLQPWHPPTPPLESDEMDWTPSQYFDPPKQPRFQNTGPSPFHGTLPALPGNARREETKQAIGLPPGHFDKRDRLPAKKEPASFMAEPKFFPRNNDTGLENIFGQVFSLGEPTSMPGPPSPGPKYVVAPPQVGEQPVQQAQPSKLPLLCAALLTITLALWSLAGILEVAVPRLKPYIVAAVLLLCIAKLFVTKVASMRVFLLVEVLVLAALGAQLFSSDHILDDVCNKVGLGILALLSLQEMYLYLQSTDHQPEGRFEEAASAALEEEMSHETPKFRARRDSLESNVSEMSMATMSTAPPDWSTPQVNRFDMRGLAMSNGFGADIASPRRNLRRR